jgi:hypothetical protein
MILVPSRRLSASLNEGRKKFTALGATLRRTSGAQPCSEPPGNATHWTGRTVAKATGASLRTVQRIWEAHRLQLHRLRRFKKSNDPAFAAKVEDVVSLYRNLKIIKTPVHFF